jgi:hypothetical protein
MSCSTYVRFYFGNYHFTAETLAEFEKQIDLDEWDQIDWEIHQLIANDRGEVADCTENTVSVCRALGISYEMHCADDLEISYIEHWQPGFPEPITCPRLITGDAAIHAEDLVTAIKDGTVSELLNRLPRPLSGATFAEDAEPTLQVN